MKTLAAILCCLWLFNLSQSQDFIQPNQLKSTTEAPYFYLGPNGVTIKCERCQPGNTGTVNKITFEAVDWELLEQRRDVGADLIKVCTTLVSNMNNFLNRNSNFNQGIGCLDRRNLTNMSRCFWVKIHSTG